MLFIFNACQIHSFRKSKIEFLGLIKGGQKKLKFGETWANIGQTFDIICFLNFEFEGTNFTLFKQAKLRF